MITEGNCSDSLSNFLTYFSRQMTLVLRICFSYWGLQCYFMVKPLLLTPPYIYLCMYPRAHLGLPKMIGNKLRIFQPHCIKLSPSLCQGRVYQEIVLFLIIMNSTACMYDLNHKLMATHSFVFPLSRFAGYLFKRVGKLTLSMIGGGILVLQVYKSTTYIPFTKAGDGVNRLTAFLLVFCHGGQFTGQLSNGFWLHHLRVHEQNVLRQNCLIVTKGQYFVSIML